MRIVAFGIGLVLFGLGIAWWRGMLGPDPQVEEIKQMQQQMAASFGEQTSDEKRRAQFDTLRTKIQQLPEAKQEEVRNAGREMFMAMMQQRMQETLALPEDERKKAFDKQIDEFERRRASGEGPPWARRGGGGQGKSENGGQAAGERRRERPDPRTMTDEQRNEMRRRMLSRTTPEGRATFTEYHRQMNERRKERGLPAMGPFGR